MRTVIQDLFLHACSYVILHVSLSLSLSLSDADSQDHTFSSPPLFQLIIIFNDFDDDDFDDPFPVPADEPGRQRDPLHHQLRALRARRRQVHELQGGERGDTGLRHGGRVEAGDSL